MLKALFLTTFVATGALSTAAFAQGDATAGESDFRSCKSCHTISNGDEVIMRGGRTGPNLFGIIGRPAGSFEGFRYGSSMTAAGEAGLVWTEALVAEFVSDPTAFLRTYLDDSGARSKMTFKARSGGEDLAAYLASVSPMMEMEMEMGGDTDSEDAGDSN